MLLVHRLRYDIENMSTRIRALAARWHLDSPMMRTLVLAALVACTPRALSVTAEHPANPDAQAGRLAGPPAALHAGAGEPPASDPGTMPTAPASGHEHHEAAPPTPAPPATGHGHHDQPSGPSDKPAPTTSPEDPKEPAAKQSAVDKALEPKQPAPRKPAVDKKPEPKPAPKQPEKKPAPKQPVDPHEGHH